MTVSRTENRAAQTATDDRPLEAGTVIGEKYELIRPLGRGAFAWVYLAKHRDIQSLRLAIKVLRPHVAFDSRVRERFRAEAVLAAQLQSPNVVRVTDYGAPEGEAPFIVMEYVQGETLRQRIERKGPVSARDVARIGIHIASALKEAHSHGIVHRDLKPSNIYLVESPTGGRFTAKVLDFGIAKVLTGLSAVEMVAFETSSLSINCTPRYASPELLRGKPSAQSDIYALGITMLEALNGMPPYTSQNTFEITAQHLSVSPVPLGNAETSALAPALRRACAKEPDERYLSATQMLDDLRERFDASATGRATVATDEFAGLRDKTTDEKGFARVSTNGRHAHSGTYANPTPDPATPPSGFETSGHVPDAGSEQQQVSNLTTLLPRFDEGQRKATGRTLLLVVGALILASVAISLRLSGQAGTETAATTSPLVAEPPETEAPPSRAIQDEQQVGAASPSGPVQDSTAATGQAFAAIGVALSSAEGARATEVSGRVEAEREADERAEEDDRDRGRSRRAREEDSPQDSRAEPLAQPVEPEPAPLAEPERQPPPRSPKRPPRTRKKARTRSVG